MPPPISARQQLASAALMPRAGRQMMTHGPREMRALKLESAYILASFCNRPHDIAKNKEDIS